MAQADPIVAAPGAPVNRPRVPGTRPGPVAAGLLLLALAVGPGWAQETLVVAVGGPADDPAYLPVHAALALGTFEAEGVTVTLRRAKHPTAAMTALRDRQAAVAVTTLDQAIRGGWVREVPVRVLLAHTRAPAAALVASRAVPQPVARPADLRGRRVGIPGPGTTGQLLLAAILRAEKLGPWQLTLESHPGATLAARLAAGGLDAAVVEEPWLSRALATGAVSLLVDFRKPDDAARALGGPFHEVVSVVADEAPEAVARARAGDRPAGRPRSGPEPTAEDRAAAEAARAAREAALGGFVRAVLRVQAWLAAAPPEAIAGRLPPPLAADREALVARLATAQPAYAPGGDATEAGLTATLKVLQGGNPWPVTLKVGPRDLREPGFVTAARTGLGPAPPAP